MKKHNWDALKTERPTMFYKLVKVKNQEINKSLGYIFWDTTRKHRQEVSDTTCCERTTNLYILNDNKHNARQKNHLIFEETAGNGGEQFYEYEQTTDLKIYFQISGTNCKINETQGCYFRYKQSRQNPWKKVAPGTETDVSLNNQADKSRSQ